MKNKDYKYEVNDFAIRLMENPQFRSNQYALFLSNNYAFEHIYGILSADTLKSILKRARRNKVLRVMLSDLLLYVDKNTISHENFQMLLRFPTAIRNTYLSNLGHIELAYYQMQVLNRYPLSLEAFSWLFDHICQFDFFTKEDMLQILRENSDIKATAVQTCIDLAYAKYGPSEKLNAASNWICNVGNDLRKP